MMIRQATTRQLVRWQQRQAFTRNSPIARSFTSFTTGLDVSPFRRTTAPNPSCPSIAVPLLCSPAHRTLLRRWMSEVVVTKTASTMTDDDPFPQVEAVVVDNTTVAYQTLSDSLAVTQSCLDRIEHLISIKHNNKKGEENEHEDLYFLRVFVDAGGCSGFQYQFEMDSEIDLEEDIVFVATADDAKHPRVVVDEASLKFMEGSTLDYVQEMIRSAFVVSENPQSESACGCGSSFAMKNFAANPALD